MRICGHYAVLNNGTILQESAKPGDDIPWSTPHWAHTNNRVLTNQVQLKNEEEGSLLCARMGIELQSFTETMAFAEIDPVRILLEAEHEGMILAYYHFKDWWTRPAFVESFDQVPGDTTLLFFRDDNRYHFWIALPGKTFRAHFQGHDKGSGQVELVLSADAAGYVSFCEDAMAAVSDTDPYRCFEKGMAYAAKLYGIPMREERTYPKVLEKIGWCSWDAFYKEISQEGMAAKAQEIREKEIPFGWLLIDDGWQDYEQERMCSFGTNKQKFPGGLKACVDEVRAITGINRVGVWHAFSGYWCGIHEDGILAKKHPEWFLPSHQGKLLIKPDPKSSEEFFSAWYQELKKEGISFVKVDSQSSTRQHYRTNTPTGETCKVLHHSLDHAAEQYMNGILINCMGMAMENVLQRPDSGISRNSDDFFPLQEESFKEHMLQNVYNGLWHNQIYYGDWDMFWSSHKYACKHAILRALSGGPVYVSDRVGDTIKEVLMPLCYEDGTILRAEKGALPTTECLLMDPEKCGYLKLFNSCREVYYLAVYSYSQDALDVRVSLQDLGLTEKNTRFAVISFVSGQGFVCDTDTSWMLPLEGEGYELYRIAKIEDGFAAFGLTDKYLSSHAIVSESRSEDATQVTLREHGIFTFYAEEEMQVFCQGEKHTAEAMTNADGEAVQGFYQISLARGEKELQFQKR